MKEYITKQERLWAGEFGNKYNVRNSNREMLGSRLALFSKIFSNTSEIDSILEIGCNIGMNIAAIKQLCPNVSITGNEINLQACKKLREEFADSIEIINDSIINLEINKQFNFVFTKGVLIHICPKYLNVVYKKIYDLSNKYILLMEYYNPTPLEVKYRGGKGTLYKRDFCGEMMDLFCDLKLIDYSFVYHRDNNFKDDDGTWFLMEKKQ